MSWNGFGHWFPERWSLAWTVRFKVPSGFYRITAKDPQMHQARQGGTSQPYSLAPAELRDWLSDPPGVSVAGRLHAVAEQVAILNLAHADSRNVGRLVATFQIAAERLVTEAFGQLRSASHPLGGETRLLARNADFLLQELARAHERQFRVHSGRVVLLGMRRRLATPVISAMRCVALRLSIVNRIHADAPRGTWNDLHRLFHMARDRGIERVRVASRSAEGEYCRALLTAFANPRRMTQEEMDGVEALLSEHLTSGCRITPAQPGAHVSGRFLVTADLDVPGRPVARFGVSPTSTELVLDCTGLLETLLERRSAIGSYRSLERVQVEGLVRHWGTMTSRRCRRLRSCARVELVVGAGSDGLESGAATSRWMVINESANGCALMHIAGPCASLRVGQVVGLSDGRMRRNCMVRWILSNDAEHLEMGLEELLPTKRLDASPMMQSLGRHDAPSAESGILPGRQSSRTSPARTSPATSRN